MLRHALWSVFTLTVLGCGSDARPVRVSEGDAGTHDAGRSAPEASVPERTSCTGLADAAGDSTITLNVGGTTRSALVHVPSTYDPEKPMAVVLNFHGATSNAAQQAAYSGLIGKSDAAGFVAVHPEGLGGAWNAGKCCNPAVADGTDDVAFVTALLDELDARLCVANKHVYATGMSNGGELAYRLACELSPRIAAIAPVAGTDLTVTCEPARPVAVMHFHGTADDTVPYEGDEKHTSVADTVAAWKQHNGCTGTPTETFAKGDSRCETYQQCADGVEVTLCTVDEGGHTWPGGLAFDFLGKTTQDLSANDAMWEFFQRHPLP